MAFLHDETRDCFGRQLAQQINRWFQIVRMRDRFKIPRQQFRLAVTGHPAKSLIHFQVPALEICDVHPRGRMSESAAKPLFTGA